MNILSFSKEFTMARNKIQFQKGLSERQFRASYGTEEQCRAALAGASGCSHTSPPEYPAPLSYCITVNPTLTFLITHYPQPILCGTKREQLCFCK